MKCLEALTLNQTCKRKIVMTGITYYRVNLSRAKFSVILEMSNVLEKVKKTRGKSEEKKIAAAFYPCRHF